MNATPPDAPDLAALTAAWKQVGPESPADEAGPVVLDCIRRLAADPGGERAHVWVYGLLSMTRYIATREGAAVTGPAVEALRAAYRAIGDPPPCGHETHPYESALDGIESDELSVCADVPDPVLLGAEHRCPHAVAMAARIAAEIIAPGTVEGIPDRVPEHHEGNIRDLASVLHGYPRGGADPAYEIAAGSWMPTHPSRGALAGHLVLLRAGCWYAASGMIRQRWVLDDMIEALEDALVRLDGAACAHTDEEHPEVSEDPDTAAGTGYYLLTPGGRARLREGYGDALPDVWTCPALLRDLAQDTRDHLTEARDRLFGERLTGHLDAEYLRADGELAVGRIAERLEPCSSNETYAEDLALWAARRHAKGTGDARERLFLFLAAARSLDNAYPDPPSSVYRSVRPLFEEAASAPPPDTCPHGDDHPGTGDGLPGEVSAHLAHLCAPESFPEPEGARPLDAWACPRNLAPVAEEWLESMEQWDEEADEE
ncbi:hypothetical protein [Streptomyces chattanoogensis]|uniref:hypothetical protein n=1 Tax=Streptomyces chattanoogensis TaxID=66876 RepID=UPI0006B43C21|nr:hypothetical protein [Streptomyces chattanoogensis]